MTVVPTDLVDELQASLPKSNVLSPTSLGYEQSLIRWTDTAMKPAALVVYVGSAEDVSTTILFCRKHSLPFVVSGGRHSTSGSSSIAGGVVIDLACMHFVTVNAAARTAHVQGGAVWRDVDEATARFGLAGVAGTVNHTGVGGLTLGGGYGWQTGKHGLVIDNLLEATVVLADGRIVKASESENVELFWAVRGAGKYFGVVTEFVFRLHEQRPKVWAGIMAFPDVGKTEPLVEFMNALVADSRGGKAGMMLGMGAVHGVPDIVQAFMAVVFYNGPKEEAEEVFAPLIALGPKLNTTAEIPYASLNAILNPVSEYGGRKVTKGPSFPVPTRPEFVRSLFAELGALYKATPDARDSIILLECHDPTVICKEPRSTMSFANRGRHQNGLVGAMWKNPDNDQACRKWTQKVAGLFEDEFKQALEAGKLEETAGYYGNYDGLFWDPKGAFGANYEELVRLKKEYDPENVFGQL